MVISVFTNPLRLMIIASARSAKKVNEHRDIRFACSVTSL
jgi:hypothetical protein